MEQYNFNGFDLSNLPNKWYIERTLKNAKEFNHLLSIFTGRNYNGGMSSRTYGLYKSNVKGNHYFIFDRYENKFGMVNTPHASYKEIKLNKLEEIITNR